MDEATAIDRLTQIAQTHDRIWVIHYATTPRRILDPVLRLLNTHAIALDEWSTPLSEGTLFALPAGVSFAAKPVALHGDVNFGDDLHLQDAQLLVPRVQPGQAIGIFTEWTATGPAAQLEVSVVDDANHVWSANAIDVPLQEAEARPRGRRINVPVPLTMPPGEYQLILNVIDTASGSPISTRPDDRIDQRHRLAVGIDHDRSGADPDRSGDAQTAHHAQRRAGRPHGDRDRDTARSDHHR